MSDSEHDSSSSSGGEEEAWAENLAEISDLIKKYANALVKAGEGATLISEAWKDYCKGNKEKKVKPVTETTVNAAVVEVLSTVSQKTTMASNYFSKMMTKLPHADRDLIENLADPQMARLKEGNASLTSDNRKLHIQVEKLQESLVKNAAAAAAAAASQKKAVVVTNNDDDDDGGVKVPVTKMLKESQAKSRRRKGGETDAEGEDDGNQTNTEGSTAFRTSFTDFFSRATSKRKVPAKEAEKFKVKLVNHYLREMSILLRNIYVNDWKAYGGKIPLNVPNTLAPIFTETVAGLPNDKEKVYKAVGLFYDTMPEEFGKFVAKNAVAIMNVAMVYIFGIPLPPSSKLAKTKKLYANGAHPWKLISQKARFAGLEPADVPTSLAFLTYGHHSVDTFLATALTLSNHAIDDDSPNDQNLYSTNFDISKMVSTEKVHVAKNPNKRSRGVDSLKDLTKPVFDKLLIVKSHEGLDKPDSFRYSVIWKDGAEKTPKSYARPDDSTPYYDLDRLRSALEKFWEIVANISTLDELYETFPLEADPDLVVNTFNTDWDNTFDGQTVPVSTTSQQKKRKKAETEDEEEEEEKKGKAKKQKTSEKRGKGKAAENDRGMGDTIDDDDEEKEKGKKTSEKPPATPFPQPVDDSEDDSDDSKEDSPAPPEKKATGSNTTTIEKKDEDEVMVDFGSHKDKEDEDEVVLTAAAPEPVVETPPAAPTRPKLMRRGADKSNI